ncbi:hypothetical protein [Moorena producens]|uniref:hypothetical protein n=1 Tax=Moorena producens TaxID=1155739 RepID=UPI0013143B40|nr:hypothetical protein [Moorena producens]
MTSTLKLWELAITLNYIALRIKVRTLIQATKAIVLNCCLLPLASCLARSAISIR